MLSPRILFFTLGLALLLLLGSASPGHAQEPEIDFTEVAFLDVLETKDGSTWRGVIVEQVPGEKYRIALKGGSVMVVPAADVVRISKVANPDHQKTPAPTPAPAPAPGTPATGTPATGTPATGGYVPPGGGGGVQSLGPPVAKSGPRLSGGLGLAFPTGDYGEGGFVETSFTAFARAGTEFINGRLGISPAARLSFTYWRNDGDVFLGSLFAGGDVRVSSHLGTVAPYVGLGLGIDLNFNDDDSTDTGVGLGLDISFGAEIYASQNASFGVGILIHPGFSPVVDGADVDISYWGLQLSGTVAP